METEKKIKDLIKRHANLMYSNYINHIRLKQEAIDRIEQEYILLTGYEIRDNDEHKKLVADYDKRLKCEIEL
jgi:hypothetical protein